MYINREIYQDKKYSDIIIILNNLKKLYKKKLFERFLIVVQIEKLKKKTNFFYKKQNLSNLQLKMIMNDLKKLII